MRMPQRIAGTVMAGVLALSISMAVAAPKGRRGGMNGPVPQAMLTRLNLTAEQQPKVHAAGDALKAEQARIKTLSTPEEKRAASRKARDDYKTALQAALTPDQQAKLQGMMAEAREFQGLGSIGYQLAGLNPALTAEQKGKIKEIAARHEPEMDKLRAAQKDATDKKAARQQIRELTRKTSGEVLAVLTPEQQTQFQAASPGKRGKSAKK